MIKHLLAINILLFFLLAKGLTSNLGCLNSDGQSFSNIDQTIRDICCSPTRLPSPFKEKILNVGLTGWAIDPQIGALQEQLKDQFTSNETGCVPQPLSPRPVPGKCYE